MSASRAPRLGFFSLAILLVLGWAADFGARYALRVVETKFDATAVRQLLVVSSVVDVVLGLGVVFALLLLCLAPRVARVVVLAQLAATLTALAVLVRGGVLLLVSSGALTGDAGIAGAAHVAGTAVTFAEAIGAGLLLLVLSRVARAAGAGAVRWLAFGGLALVLVRMMALALALTVAPDPATQELLQQTQAWALLGYELLTLGLCIHAGVVVTRIPDEVGA
jgi:hypothetical protein